MHLRLFLILIPHIYSLPAPPQIELTTHKATEAPSIPLNKSSYSERKQKLWDDLDSNYSFEQNPNPIDSFDKFDWKKWTEEKDFNENPVKAKDYIRPSIHETPSVYSPTSNLNSDSSYYDGFEELDQIINKFILEETQNLLLKPDYYVSTAKLALKKQAEGRKERLSKMSRPRQRKHSRFRIEYLNSKFFTWFISNFRFGTY